MGRWVHSCSSGFTQAGVVIVLFIRVSLHSLERDTGSSGSFGFAWVDLCAPKCG